MKENKIFQFEIKEFTDQGKFTGYLATFGNVDAGDDTVDPGAFKKTLRENKSFPLNWGHMPKEPDLVVGTFTGKEDEKGLHIEGEYFLDLDGGKKAYMTTKALLEKGVKIGLSMGYKTIRDALEKVEGGFVRHLKEVKLNEGALTLFPMNPLASLVSLKEEEEGAEEEIAIEAGSLEPASKKDEEFTCASCGQTLLSKEPAAMERLLKVLPAATLEEKPSQAEKFRDIFK